MHCYFESESFGSLSNAQKLPQGAGGKIYHVCVPAYINFHFINWHDSEQLSFVQRKWVSSVHVDFLEYALDVHRTLNGKVC